MWPNYAHNSQPFVKNMVAIGVNGVGPLPPPPMNDLALFLMISCIITIFTRGEARKET